MPRPYNGPPSLLTESTEEMSAYWQRTVSEVAADVTRAMEEAEERAKRERNTLICVTCTVAELREVLQCAGYYVHQAGSHDPAFLSGLEVLKAQLNRTPDNA